MPIVGVVVLAYLYARWANRARGPQEPVDSVQAYERFRQVMAAPPPPVQRRPAGRARILSRR